MKISQEWKKPSNKKKEEIKMKITWNHQAADDYHLHSNMCNVNWAAHKKRSEENEWKQKKGKSSNNKKVFFVLAAKTTILSICSEIIVI